MRYTRIIAVVLLALLLLTGTSGCLIRMDEESQEAMVSGDSIAVAKEKTVELDDQSFEDDPYLYATGGGDSVVTMYLTVSRGGKAENTNYSWGEINSHSIYDFREQSIPRYQVEGLLQVGDENGPVAGELGFGQTTPNATVQIRGATTSREAQKSYKIELTTSGAQWRGQRTIALNKHIFDGLRFRNMLAYELLQDVPDTISLRTQFVHLWVKDETEGKTGAFVDYGLYTQVEQTNKRTLRNHGLDEEGQLYKLNYFEFQTYAEIRLKTDPAYDQEAFEQLLEIKGNDDHTKLMDMLAAVNDFSTPIDQTFEKYFDADNYFTLRAFNILMGNIDTTNRNLCLYSPKNGEKWYLFNWDCDAVLYRSESLNPEENMGYEYGVSNYWGDLLFNRLMRLSKYQKLLDDRVEQLHKLITPQRIRAMAEKYARVAKPYVYRMPDVEHARLLEQDYDGMIGLIAEETERNYLLYKTSLTKPMPFYLDVPMDNGSLLFEWDSAYTLDGQGVRYTFELAHDHLFQDVITRAENLQLPTYETDMLEPGKYYYRVMATNEQGKSQSAMEYYTYEGVKYFGIMSFYVRQDGSIEPEVPVE